MEHQQRVGAQRQAMEAAQALGRREDGNLEGGQARGESDLPCRPRGLNGIGSHGRFFKERGDTVALFLWESKALMVCWLVL